MPTGYILAGNTYAKVARQSQDEDAEVSMDQVLVKTAKLTFNPETSVPNFASSELIVRVLRPNYPDFTWLDDDMFHENAIFPYNISYNSEGTEVFSTDIDAADSGHNQRLSYWSEPLMEFNIAYGVRTMEQLHALKRLFRVVRGQKDGFRYRDTMDYTSSFAVGEEARAPDDITAFDQQIGVGDGQAFEFQLVKIYEFEGEEVIRTIRKPEVGTVLVAVAGVQYPEGAYTVDHTTGMVTLDERASLTINDVTMSTVMFDPSSHDVTWTSGHMPSDFVVGDWVQISGFANPLNRVTEEDCWEIEAIYPEESRIRFITPSGHDIALGVAESAAAEVRISTVISPPPGRAVTAGYLFHLPVRFQTDRLPLRLEAYGIGSATEVKLIEIRG